MIGEDGVLLNVVNDKKIIIPLHKPGLKEKYFFLISGLIVSIPITFFVNIFSNHLCFLLPVFYSELCAVGFFAPFIEEFSKAFPLFYRHGETEKSIFILGFLVGLGFGLTEFLIYVFGGTSVYIRLPGIFFHAASTSITAYGIATNRAIQFYLLATGLHLSYNFSVVMGDPFWLIVAYAFLILTYFLSWHLYHKTSERAAGSVQFS
ncbi:Protease prsW family protein [uncultured archaeon]|nr:Protease prsW family protein [uncultured archaeon]